jgi:NAD+-dependent protein deacetylase sirtuin 4
MLDPLVRALEGRSIAVLSGAGISTESGIPDYRGPETRRRARNPVRFQTFISSPEAEQRYWARSMIGWPKMAGARANDGHRAIAALERGGFVRGVVTQNVDRLHHAAGSRHVVELHGALAEVVCLDCRAIELRAELQERMRAENPHFAPELVELAPDGDAVIEGAGDFRVPRCGACSGRLKPNVVFFGESVPKPVVERAFAIVEGADALLVVGSSLAVYSGLRFVRRARELGRVVAIVNLGETRGDDLADVRIDGAAGAVLTALEARLSNRGGSTRGGSDREGSVRDAITSERSSGLRHADHQ